MARFTGRDPVLGKFQEPLTLHAYLYCLNDPINRTDLTGEFSLVGPMLTAGKYGLKAYSAYTTGQTIKGYAQELANGASVRSILLSVAIDAGIDYLGGKIFKSALKGLGKIAKRFSRSINTGNNKIYRSLDADGNVQYIGRTNDIPRRAGEQFRDKGIKIEGLAGLDNLSLEDARAVEQVFIEHHGLGKNGGTLLNRINSISTKNPDYDRLIERGNEILDAIGFEF